MVSKFCVFYEVLVEFAKIVQNFLFIGREIFINHFAEDSVILRVITYRSFIELVKSLS